MAVTATTTDALVLGPGNLTFGGTDLGATEGNATLKFARKSYAPRFTGSGGPLKGGRRQFEFIPMLTVTLGEFSLATLQASMPGSTVTGDGSATPEEMTTTIGRIADAEYQDAVLTVDPGDGRTITVTIENALADIDEDVEAEFGDEAHGSHEVTFIGHYDPATPTVAPYKISRALAA